MLPEAFVSRMRPAPITLRRCIEQARMARDAAAIAQNPRERARLIHVAVAYEALATKAH